MIQLNRIAALCFAPILAYTLIGCVGAEPDASIDPMDGEEEVSETQLALGEMGCSTVTADASVSVQFTCTNYTSTSANSSYDHSTYCPNQYVVEFTPSAHYYDIQVLAQWGDTAITNATDCSKAKVEIGAYRFDSANNQWVDPAEIAIFSGNWSGTVCSLTKTSGDDLILTNTNTDRHRVAVKAYYLESNGSKTMKKATAKVKYYASCLAEPNEPVEQ